MTIDTKSLVTLLEVAAKAIEANRYEWTRKSASMALKAAYSFWKVKNGVEYVTRDTPDWLRMMAGTKLEFDNLERAKRKERDARRRLQTAIRRYQIETGDAA